jgi:thiamine-phosphate pyrophosphorylase
LKRNSHRLLHGLYAITDTHLCPDEVLITSVEQALLGGCRLVQYRDKRADHPGRRDQAHQLQALCHRHQALLIINDDLALAQEVAADGVHLGRQDPDPVHARSLLGEQAIIGVSCYNRLDLALEAVRLGVDYVAFGRFFPSQTKPLAVQATPELLRQARAALELPLVAIGGITPENGGPLIEAGADMLAVIQGIFGQPDIRTACRQLSELFEPKETRV